MKQKVNWVYLKESMLSWLYFLTRNNKGLEVIMKLNLKMYLSPT